MQTVVLVTGRARSGKDTFISETMKLLDPKLFTVQTISSISNIKAGLDVALRRSGIAWDMNKLTQADRQCLSDIKVALDKHYSFTDAYLAEILSDYDRYPPRTDVVLFYQVREPTNIKIIKDRYKTWKSRRALSVLLIREPYPKDQPLADVEREYDGADFDLSYTCDSMDRVHASALDFARILMENLERRRLQASAS